MNAQGVGIAVSRLELDTDSLKVAYLEGEVASYPTQSVDPVIGFARLLDQLQTEGYADGINLFQCRACGRTYVASCHP